MDYRNQHFALELMQTGLLFLERAQLRKSTLDNYQDPFRSLMLYSIVETKKGLWLPLNRDYNVLGLSEFSYVRNWSDYKSDLYDHMLIKSEDINFNVLWQNDPENYFTFSDSSSPGFCYSKNIREKRNFERYKTIIETGFFGKKSKHSFQDLWKYKTQSSLYAEEWKINISRVEEFKQ